MHSYFVFLATAITSLSIFAEMMQNLPAKEKVELQAVKTIISNLNRHWNLFKNEIQCAFGLFDASAGADT